MKVTGDVDDPRELIEVPTDLGAVASLLTILFPDLTEAELKVYASKLSITAMLELKLEIEALRAVAATLGKELTDLAQTSAEERATKLEPHQGGYPAQLTPVGLAAFYDEQSREARVDLSAVFEGRQAILLQASEVSASIDGSLQSGTLSCAHQGAPVDIVLLVDITGSMSSVIRAVRDSLLRFVEGVAASGVHGTLSVVTFQDTVGVNVSFQEPKPKSGYERSPFLANVAIDDAAGMEALKRFIARLEANSGRDRPENLAAAIDFANDNVIGLDSRKLPNVIGDGIDDPRDVKPFPTLANGRRIFAAFTDAPFHADSRTEANSSLLKPFKARPLADILRSLQVRGTTVHVSDPSWVDLTVEPTGSSSEESVDSDYWAVHTGGVGRDETVGYARNDLDLLVVAKESGLLDVVLDRTVASSCTLRIPNVSLSASGRIELNVVHGAAQFSASLLPTRF